MDSILKVRRLKLDNESFETDTSASQVKVEKKVEKLYNQYSSIAECDPSFPVLNKKTHLNYIKNHLNVLPQNYECLDSSRPWLCYWLCQSLALLNSELTVDEKSELVTFLSK